MPRLPAALVQRARHEHPLLPRLLRPCRDLDSARNELRWLREHEQGLSQRGPRSRKRSQLKLNQLCREREGGKPLQYILGSQPFGDLDIVCRSGVLIPRVETESIVSHLAATLFNLPRQRRASPQPLRILDLCTGSGCIPLLLHSILAHSVKDVIICGVDISPAAIHLARDNIEHNIRLGHLRRSARYQVSFVHDDLFSDNDRPWRKSKWDIVISNPPYISPDAFEHTTSRSVRNFEPKTALVPRPTNTHTGAPPSDLDIGDSFYPEILQMANSVGARAVLMEVSDKAQAIRVIASIIQGGSWSNCEIWRDWPGQSANGRHETEEISGQDILARGLGNGRAVLAWRGGE